MRAPIHLPLFPTGVGATHHVDAAEAVSDILSGYWRMPFWPQLPNRAAEELPLPQFGLALPGARWDGATLRWSGQPDSVLLETAPLPPAERAAGLHEFLSRLGAISEDDPRRPPVVKGQIVGPLTLAMNARDDAGRAPHEDAATLAWLAAWLGRAAARQAEAFQRLGYQAMIVFDEPALAYLNEPALPLRWREAIAILRAALEPVQETGAIAGLHCCRTPNWTRVLESRPDIIHFDAREASVQDMIEHKRAVREHVARGGYLGWGLWSTDGSGAPLFDAKQMQYALALAARELSFVDASVGLIFKRSILTNVCGGAGLGAEDAARAAADLEELSMGIRKRYWIAATTDVDPNDPLT